MELSEKQRNLVKGILLAAVSVIGWGTIFPASQYLLRTKQADAYTLTAIRFLGASAALLLGYALSHKGKILEKIGLREIFDFVIQGLFMSGMSLLLFLAQKTIPVVNASMLESETPLLVFILGMVILKEKATVVQFLGLMLGFCGSLFVLKCADFHGFHFESFQFGDLLVILSALSWALYTVLSRRTIRKLGGFLYSGWSMLFGGSWVVLVLLLIPGKHPLPATQTGFWLAAYLALVTTALTFFCWNTAQRFIKVGLLAISGYFTPMIAALLGWMIFGEKITLSQITGMILVFGASLIEPDINDLLRGLLCRNKISR